MPEPCERQCIDCAFYYVDGLCHRFPPTVCIHDGSVYYAQPQVDEDDWCGEWKKEGKKLKEWREE